MFILSRLDLLGTPATLNFFGSDKKRSCFGGVCSLFFLGFVIWAIVNSSRSFFDRTDPKLVISNQKLEDPRQMSISNNDFPIGYIIQAPSALNTTGFSDESIYTFQLTHKMLQRVQQPDGSFKKVWTITPLKVEKCTKEYFGEYASSFSSFTFLGSYCISQNQTNLERLKIKGVYASTEYQALIATVKVCNPNTTKVGCASQDKIKQYLSGSWFNAVYIDTVINTQDFSHPFGKFREVHTSFMNPSSYKEVSYEVGYVEVSTDSGWFTPSINVDSSLMLANVGEATDSNPSPDGTLLTCVFQASRLETYYTRSYKKIQTVLAEVGGLANTVLAVLLILTNPYLRLKARESLMKELFDVKGGESEANKKKKVIGSKQKSRLRKNTDRALTEEKTKAYRESLSSPMTLSSPKNLFQIGSPLNAVNDTSQKQEAFPSPRGSSARKELPRYESSQGTDNNDPNVLSDIQLQLRLSSVGPQEDFAKQTEGYFSPRAEQHKLLRVGGDIFEIDEIPNNLDFQTNNEKGDVIAIDGLGKTQGDYERIVSEKDYFHSDTHRFETKERKLSIQPTQVEMVRKRDELQDQPVVIDLEEKLNNKEKYGELRFWEYVLSFIYKTKALKSKFRFIKEGTKNIERRMDLSHILEKFSELDRLIVLLLDPDQLQLFNNMPKPPINVLEKKQLLRADTYHENRTTRINLALANKNEEKARNAYDRIRNKVGKTDIDKRLIEAFARKNF